MKRYLETAEAESETKQQSQVTNMRQIPEGKSSIVSDRRQE